MVSGKTVSCNYSIQGGDELTHTVHRHEPAVSLSDLPSNASYCTIDQPPVDIIYEDESILVVDKPSTMPIHPCGAYHYNSLFEILAHWKRDSYGAKKLYTIYRLDRLTSGVVLLAKNAQLARSLGKCIVERDGCEKIYLARVKGKFPLNLLERNIDESCEFQVCDSADTKEELPAPCVYGELTELTKRYWKGGKQVLLPNGVAFGAGLGYWLTDQRGHVTTAASLQDIFRQSLTAAPNDIISLATSQTIEQYDKSDGADRSSRLHWLNFACPCRVSSHKDGVCEAGDFSHLTDDDKCKGVKPAQTAFTLLSYDASTDTSVLIAKPITGRTHQIRLHLQQLGHPIANDHCYGGDLWCGDAASKDACENARQWLDQLDNTASGFKAPAQSTLTDTPATNAEIYHVVANKRRECGETLRDFIEKTCVWCARCKGVIALSNNNHGEEESKHQIHQAVMNRTLMEFFVRSHGIWLHALQYRLTSTCEDGPNKYISYRTQLPIWTNMK